MDEPSLAARFVINVAEAMGLVCAKRQCTTSSVSFADSGRLRPTIPRRRLSVRFLTGLVGYGACMCKWACFFGQSGRLRPNACPYRVCAIIVGIALWGSFDKNRHTTHGIAAAPGRGAPWCSRQRTACTRIHTGQRQWGLCVRRGSVPPHPSAALTLVACDLPSQGEGFG